MICILFRSLTPSRNGSILTGILSQPSKYFKCLNYKHVICSKCLTIIFQNFQTKGGSWQGQIQLEKFQMLRPRSILQGYHVYIFPLKYIISLDWGWNRVRNKLNFICQHPLFLIIMNVFSNQRFIFVFRLWISKKPSVIVQFPVD